MQECIRVSELSKWYHKRQVVRSINFEVEQGQIFAFLGPNGAGKSTTMKMISTLLQKSGGSIFVDGLNLDECEAAVKRKIGIVFQEDVLDSELTVYKNLYYRGGLYIPAKRQLEKRIHWVARLLKLDAILSQRYGDCSGGQKRLVQIARALLHNPRLLVLDEPTTGLDPITRHNVWKTLLRLRNQLSMTVFFTTHYLDEAAYADRLCVLSNGNILMCDSLKNLGVSPNTQPNGLDSIYFSLLNKEGEQ